MNRRLELLRHHQRAAEDKIDSPSWRFDRPDEEYQGCAPTRLLVVPLAHNGRGRLISVEVTGGTPLVQYYFEVLAEQVVTRARGARLLQLSGRKPS
jgi:hypothetical protein